MVYTFTFTVQSQPGKRRYNVGTQPTWRGVAWHGVVQSRYIPGVTINLNDILFRRADRQFSICRLVYISRREGEREGPALEMQFLGVLVSFSPVWTLDQPASSYARLPQRLDEKIIIPGERSVMGNEIILAPLVAPPPIDICAYVLVFGRRMNLPSLLFQMLESTNNLGQMMD